MLSRLLACLTAVALLFPGFTLLAQSGTKPHSIWSVEWSADGRYIAIGGDDGMLRIHSGTNYQLLQTHALGVEIKCLSWHPKESWLAIATSRGLHLYDVDRHQLTAVAAITVGGRAVDWHPAGEWLALADGNGVVQILNRQGTLLQTIKKHNQNSFVTVHWHPTENKLLTGSDEMIMFDSSGKQLAFIRHRTENTLLLTARWHPSGKWFASGDYGHAEEGIPTVLQFWKEDGTLIQTVMGHGKEIRNLRWSKDGNTLATGSDGLRLWSKDGKLLHEARTQDVVWGVSWDPTGTRLVTATFEGQVEIWSNSANLLKKLY